MRNNLWKCFNGRLSEIEKHPRRFRRKLAVSFQSLHSNDPLNVYQQNIVTELPDQENSNMQSLPLDYLITEIKIHSAVQKLKNNKSPLSDRIQNEMIKTSSVNEMMPVYHKLFLKVYGGLITPVFKSGNRSDPSNYRGICVSSCLGKLFCSILNQRLLECVTNSLNMLHKSQIGFLPKNRTADHVLTLRTLIDKYVIGHHEKVYACFVDFRKAFNSVWHNGLLYKIYCKLMSGETFIS